MQHLAPCRNSSPTLAALPLLGVGRVPRSVAGGPERHAHLYDKGWNRRDPPIFSYIFPTSSYILPDFFDFFLDSFGFFFFVKR